MHRMSAGAVAVDIEVHDYSGLSEKSLHQVVLSIGRILSGGGVSVQVVGCPAISKAVCDVSVRSAGSLQVRILRQAPTTRTGRRLPVLGQAVVSHHGGTYATVFLDPVQQQAFAAGVPWAVVLAHAAAHEVGHLLLGSAHTPGGLMRAHWSRSDYQSMNEWACHLDADQARKLASISAGPPLP